MGSTSATWSTFILMKWFGVSAQLQLLNANHCVILAHGITSVLLMRGQNQYRGQKCTIGRRAAIRHRDSPSLQFPWQRVAGASLMRGVTYQPYKALAPEGLSRPTLISAPTWLDYVAKLANKMLTCKTKLSENQYQIIAQPLLGDKLILYIMSLQF